MVSKNKLLLGNNRVLKLDDGGESNNVFATETVDLTYIPKNCEIGSPALYYDRMSL